MYRYTVERRWRQANGEFGKYIDFRYAKGIKEVRKLCGNIGRAKWAPTVYGEHIVYTGDDGKMIFKVVRCGEWK